MKKACLSTMLLFSLLVYSGCVSRYAITYNTDPESASLICNGVHYGYTPVTLYYDLKNSDSMLEMCEAVWMSGARSVYQIQWDTMMRENPDGFALTLQRPDYPNLDEDVEFALKKRHERLRIQQKESVTNAMEEQIQNEHNRHLQNSLNRFNYLK